MTTAIGGGGDEGLIYATEQVAAKAAAVLKEAQVVSAERDAQSEESETVASPGLEKKKEKTKAEFADRVQKLVKAEGALMLPVEAIGEAAEKFARNRQNPEIDVEKLKALGQAIKRGDSKEDVLYALAKFYKDPFLASEALEFLVEMSAGTDMESTIKAARDDFTAGFQQQIVAGRNTQKVMLAASKEGLGTPEELRKTYNEFTLSSPDSQTLFQQLTKTYNNDYDKIEQHLLFLMHSLGVELKSVLGNDMRVKSSLPPPKLQRLISEAKTCQDIKNIYRFFSGGMGLVQKRFKKEGLQMPAQLTFENIAAQFMGFVADHAQSPLKVAQMAPKLGIENSVQAQIIVFEQMRDAVPKVAPRIFKSAANREDQIQRRDDCKVHILNQLENLYELQDEAEEKIAIQKEQPKEASESKPIENK